MAAPSREHRGQDRVDGVDHAQDVDPERLLDRLDVHGLERRGHADARVGDQQVGRPERLGQLLDRGRSPAPVADVGRSPRPRPRPARGSRRRPRRAARVACAIRPTRQPSPASALASARPIPLDAPVITAVRPAIRRSIQGAVSADRSDRTDRVREPTDTFPVLAPARKPSFPATDLARSWSADSGKVAEPRMADSRRERDLSDAPRRTGS